MPELIMSSGTELFPHYKSEFTCCFSGHRPQKLPWGYDESDSRCLELKELIAEQLHLFYDEGVRRFVCGMAAGCDFYFAEEVIRLAREKRDIVLEAAIPFAGQPDSLPTAELKDRYKDILAHCEIQTVLSSHYHSFCMQLRNRYMVDISDKLLAVSAGLVGGTSYTIEYAKRKGLKTVVIKL